MIKAKLNDIAGIVINVNQFKDDSAIVTLASENGLIPVTANHIYQVKSSYKALLNIGSIVQVECRQKSEGPLFVSSVNTILDMTPLYSSMDSASFLFFFSQLSALLFQEGDNYPYDAIKKILGAVKGGADLLSSTLLIVGSFYKDLGLKQEVDCCIKCKNTKGIVSYSLKDGGFLCKNCLSSSSEIKDNLELFVFKYTFSEVTEEALKRVVPKDYGIKVLLLTTRYLLDYYDLKKCESLDLFLCSLG